MHGHYKQCLEFAPDDAWSWANLGITYKNVNNLEMAEFCLRQAVELDNKMFWAHYKLGRILQEKKDYESALEQFQKAISPDWEYGGPHWGLGEIYRECLDQPEKAISEYEITLQLEQRPYQLSRIIFGLARALEAAGRTSEARQRYQEYLDRFPWGRRAPEALAALKRLGGT